MNEIEIKNENGSITKLAYPKYLDNQIQEIINNKSLSEEEQNKQIIELIAIDNKEHYFEGMQEVVAEKDGSKLFRPENIRLTLAIFGTIVSVAILATALKGCSVDDKKVADGSNIKNEATITQTPEISIEDMKEDTSFVKVNEDSIAKAATYTKEEFSKAGIVITDEQALYYVTIKNIEDIAHSNPQLLTQIFGANPNVDEIMSTYRKVLSDEINLRIAGNDIDLSSTYLNSNDKDFYNETKSSYKRIREITGVNTEYRLTKEDLEKIATEVETIVNTGYFNPNNSKQPSMGAAGTEGVIYSTLITVLASSDNINENETLKNLISFLQKETDAIASYRSIISNNCNTLTEEEASINDDIDKAIKSGASYAEILKLIEAKKVSPSDDFELSKHI